MFLTIFPRKNARAKSIKDINAFIRFEDFCKALSLFYRDYFRPVINVPYNKTSEDANR